MFNGPSPSLSPPRPGSCRVPGGWSINSDRADLCRSQVCFAASDGPRWGEFIRSRNSTCSIRWPAWAPLWFIADRLASGCKWFPDKRGLAAGLITAAFGAGAAPFIPIISHILRVSDYRAAFLYTGVMQGLLIVCAAQFLQNPARDAAPPVKTAAKVSVRSHGEQFNSWEMLRTPQFYVLYMMMLMMGIGGLMVTAQAAQVADTFKISRTALTFALTLNPIANGASRLFWGWVSDHLGRERTMAVAFFIQSACLASVMTVGRSSDTAFIVCLALVFFTWGEVYALFPPAVADFFGSRNVSSNYGFMYSTKGVASIVGGGIAALIFEKTGSWSAVFYGSAVLAFCSALMAIALIKMPLPRRKTADSMVASGVRG